VKRQHRLGLLAGLLVVLPLRAEPLHVAVAANFSAPMQDIAAAFEAETGHTLALSFGASGKFFAQISNGAPFAVFFSADQAKPRKLEDEGLAVAGTRFTYAIGALVLWSADDALVDSDGAILKEGRFDRLALSNPRLAPYGAAAVEVLTALDLAASTRDRWVMGQNISQTYQFVHSGAAPLGLVARSQVMADGQIIRGSAWRVPEALYAPIRQDAILLRTAADNPVARQLLAFVRGSTARSLIERYGYGLPTP